MSKKLNYKLVKIEWVDSVFGAQGWKHIIEQEPQVTKFISVGYLVKDTKKYKHLYPHIEKEKDKDLMGAGDMIIPTASIIKMKVLE